MGTPYGTTWSARRERHFFAAITAAEDAGVAYPRRLERFLLFRGVNDRGGGWNDFAGSYPTMECAVNAVNSQCFHHDWWHVVDSVLGGKVVQGGPVV